MSTLGLAKAKLNFEGKLSLYHYQVTGYLLGIQHGISAKKARYILLTFEFCDKKRLFGVITLA